MSSKHCAQNRSDKCTIQCIFDCRVEFMAKFTATVLAHV